MSFMPQDINHVKSMSDTELLRRIARFAGYEVTETSDCFFLSHPYDGRPNVDDPWDPILRSDDSMCLQARLKIDVIYGLDGPTVAFVDEECVETFSYELEVDITDRDPLQGTIAEGAMLKTTRLAIAHLIAILDIHYARLEGRGAPDHALSSS